MKKILALLLSVLMLFSLAACKGADENGAMSDSPLPAPELKVDYQVKDDFKIGFICLHDEKSTYDLNFISAAEEAIEAIGL